MRPHLATLVESFLGNAKNTAVVAHRGVRRYETSYGAVAELAGRFATELKRRGIVPGERVVLWGANSAEWIAVFFGCLLQGVLAVPLDAAGSPAFAERVMQEVSPRLVVGDAALLAKLPLEAQSVPLLQLRGLETVLPPEPTYAASTAVHRDAPFQIVFTSGTTGEPKGVVHTHGNVLASLEPIERELAKYARYARVVHPLRFLHTLPLSHVFGQFMGLWLPCLLAAELHFSDAAEAGRLVTMLRRERISVLVAVPRMLELMERYLRQRLTPRQRAKLLRPSSGKFWWRWWRFRAVHRLLGWKFWAVISGGAAVSQELEAFWNDVGIALIQGYGMTETAALVTLNHPFHVGRGSIGKPLPGREVRLSETGEILVRGDVVAQATWQNGGMQSRSSEWLRTGDLAEQEAGGELRFVGRTGDVIVTAAGMNVHPVDLERVLQAQPGVRQAAVVPCSVETAGSAKEPVAVVLFEGPDEALRGVLHGANDTLAEYQRMSHILRWPEPSFPYTSTGKLLRRKVGTWACEELANRPASELDAPRATADWLIATIAEITGRAPIAGGEERRLTEALHLDSLGRVQLAAALEQRVGVNVDADTMSQVQTLAQLRALLTGQSGANNPEAQPKARTTGQQRSTERGPGRTGPETPGSVGQTAMGAQTRMPQWPRWWIVRKVRGWFVRGVVRPLVNLLGAPRVSGVDGRSFDAPQLIIANHVTTYDAALILAALPSARSQRLAIAMSGEVLANLRRGREQGSWWRNLLAPVGYWLAAALFHVFPLPRLRGFQRSFQHAGEALDRGESVLIFPEGSRSYTGVLAPFRPGIGLLAQQAQVAVVPIGLLGLGTVAHQEAGWFRSGRLEVRVGAPIAYEETRTPGEWTVLLEAALRKLIGQEPGKRGCVPG